MVKRKVPDPETAALAARIGRRVRALRLERNLTQSALAEGIKLPRIFVSEFERGLRANPTLRVLRLFADGLAVPVHELLSGTDRSAVEDEDERDAPSQ